MSKPCNCGTPLLIPFDCDRVQRKATLDRRFGGAVGPPGRERMTGALRLGANVHRRGQRYEA